MRCSNGLAWRMAIPGAVMLALVLPMGAQAEGLLWDTDFNLGYDSNVSNAEHDSDIRSSRFVTAGLRADYSSRISDRTSLLLRGGGQAEAYDDFSGLNNGRLSGMARLVYHPSEESRAASWSFWGYAARREFNSRLRDSNEFRAGAFMTKPLDPQLSTRLSLSASRRRADDGAVFDVDGVAAAADLDWRATSTLTIYGGLQFQDGDVVSTTTPSPSIRDVAHARAPDDVFRSRVSYRLDANTWIGTLGFNYGLSPTMALDVQAQYVNADAAGDNRYQRWIFVAGLLARF